MSVYSASNKFIILFVLILSFFQVLFTELWNDEAYYWVFSQNLQWGYLDHPPATPVIIWIGTLFFGKTEIGVRIGFVVLLFATFFLIHLMTEKEKRNQLPIICISLVALFIGGILAVPDIPLLFFTALYIFIFKKYIYHDNFKNAIFLALCIALMLYSKYHGILTILVSLFSFPELFKRKTFYLVFFTSLSLFLPHIWWQYSHAFPSVDYHLFERSAGSYDVLNTINYLGSQFLILGPFTGWMFFSYAFKIRNKEKTNRWNIFLSNGFLFILLFFFLMSFKGHTEANWTAPAAVFGLLYLLQNISEKHFNWFKKLMPIHLAFILLIKIQMAFPYIGVLKQIRNEWSGNKTWATSVYKRAGEQPVVFLNSYQKPSQYMFYSNGMAMSLNSVEGRRNQFEYFKYENQFRNKTVLFIRGWQEENCNTIKVPNQQDICFEEINNFNSFQRIKIIPSNFPEQMNAGDSVQINCKIDFSDYKNEQFDKLSYPMLLSYHFFSGKEISASINTSIKINPEKKEVLFYLKCPQNEGKYNVRFSLLGYPSYDVINSKLYKIKVNSIQ